jgi:hypothetical protein
MTVQQHNPNHLQRGRQLVLEHAFAARMVLAGLIAMGVGISNLSPGLALQGLQSTLIGLHQAGRSTITAALPEDDISTNTPSPAMVVSQVLPA